MATFHLEVKTGPKGKAAGHSAYIGREGKYRSREDLVETGCGNLPAWAGGSVQRFWSAADIYERANGAAYREFIVALPNELFEGELNHLVQDLVRNLAGEKPYEYAVHAPEASLEGGINLHLHLMVSDRLPDGVDRSESQMFRRYNPTRPEEGGCKKDACGLTRGEVRDRLIGLRGMVAKIINWHLARSGIEERVDHRTLREQGLFRKAERHLGAFRIRGMAPNERTAYIETRRTMRSGDWL